MSDDNLKPTRSPVTMTPLYDHVLVRLDVKQLHALDPRTIRRGKPTVLPSGVVVAVGTGTLVAGIGLVPLQVKVGDHVAFPTSSIPGRLQQLNDPEERIYHVMVRESEITGLLHGATQDSAWFGSGADDTSELLQ